MQGQRRLWKRESSGTAFFTGAARFRPATTYEWNKEKGTVTFQVPGETEFYMAGFYQKYGEEDCFVILTVAANASVEPGTRPDASDPDERAGGTLDL